MFQPKMHGESLVCLLKKGTHLSQLQYPSKNNVYTPSHIVPNSPVLILIYTSKRVQKLAKSDRKVDTKLMHVQPRYYKRMKFQGFTGLVLVRNCIKTLGPKPQTY